MRFFPISCGDSGIGAILERMFHAEVDTAQRVLTMSFGQHVDATEMKSCLEKVREMLADIKPGFRLLTDLTSLESMDADCSTDLGEMMSLCDAKGISAVLTVVPHPKKDIGFALMEPFHYGKDVQMTTHETLADAVQSLAASINDEENSPESLTLA